MIKTSFEDVKKVLKENLELEGINLDDLKPENPLFEGLGLDSIDAIELIVVLKKKYGISIEDMKTGKAVFQTFETLRKYIEENRIK